MLGCRNDHSRHMDMDETLLPGPTLPELEALQRRAISEGRTDDASQLGVMIRLLSERTGSARTLDVYTLLLFVVGAVAILCWVVWVSSNSA